MSNEVPLIAEIIAPNGRLSRELFEKNIVPKIDKLEKENRLLKQTVEFYCDSFNHKSDQGKKARQAREALGFNG